VYSRNRIGPRTDPWGTPQRTSVGTDLNAPQRTKCVRRSTYELNHFNTQPRRPYDVSRRRSKIPWSTVSNAAERSSSVSIARSPPRYVLTRLNPYI